MCLETNGWRKKPRILKKDKTVYVIRRIENKKIMSPFYDHFGWKIGKIYTEDNFQMEMDYWNDIDVGFHSITKISHIKKEIKDRTYQDYCGSTFKIFKAMIPKGSLYWKGKWEGTKSICSNQIKLIKEL